MSDPTLWCPRAALGLKMSGWPHSSCTRPPSPTSEPLPALVAALGGAFPHFWLAEPHSGLTAQAKKAYFRWCKGQGWGLWAWSRFSFQLWVCALGQDSVT